MAAMITQEMLKNLKAGTPITGVILVKNYSIQKTKNDKEYIVGKLQSGTDIPFKAWNNSGAFGALSKEDYQNIPTHISGTVDDYGGSLSIVLDSAIATSEYTADQFFPIRYNEEAYWGALDGFMQKVLSENGYSIFKAILVDNVELNKRFREEFAAMSHHDNCKSGLLAHTYKCVSLMSVVVNTYTSLTKIADYGEKEMSDLLFLGVALHDIGKTVEMNFGVYTPESVVTHTYLGMEFIAKYKDMIVEKYNLDWYYKLTSIILEHHGDFGMPCKSVVAYVVNQVDILDASMSDLNQNIEDKSRGEAIKIDGKYLMI